MQRIESPENASEPANPIAKLKLEAKFEAPQTVEAFLRMERVLPEETIKAITELIRVAYALGKGER